MKWSKTVQCHESVHWRFQHYIFSYSTLLSQALQKRAQILCIGQPHSRWSLWRATELSAYSWHVLTTRRLNGHGTRPSWALTTSCDWHEGFGRALHWSQIACLLAFRVNVLLGNIYIWYSIAYLLNKFQLVYLVGLRWLVAWFFTSNRKNWFVKKHAAVHSLHNIRYMQPIISVEYYYNISYVIKKNEEILRDFRGLISASKTHTHWRYQDQKFINTIITKNQSIAITKHSISYSLNFSYFRFQ